MILLRDNIKLVRLTEPYIELVRRWRNDPAIQQRMEYREYITPEMQRAWFHSINNQHNNFFLVETDGKFIGLISATDIDWDANVTNNGGIFIWDNDHLESATVAGASLLLTDMGFLMGMEKNYIKILQDNKRSIAFNKALGYELLPGQEDVYNQRYGLTAVRYFTATDKIRKYMGIGSVIQIIGGRDEYEAYRALEEKMNKTSPRYRDILQVKIVLQ